MSKNWNPDSGFPTPEQLGRMVAAEVKHLAEAEYARQRGIEERQESRRDRLRAAYRLQHREVGRKVNLDAVDLSDFLDRIHLILPSGTFVRFL